MIQLRDWSLPSPEKYGQEFFRQNIILYQEKLYGRKKLGLFSADPYTIVLHRSIYLTVAFNLDLKPLDFEYVGANPLHQLGSRKLPTFITPQLGTQQVGRHSHEQSCIDKFKTVNQVATVVSNFFDGQLYFSRKFSHHDHHSLHQGNGTNVTKLVILRRIN